MSELFINIITIDDFKSYQQGWSENFEDNQIQDAINIATNDLNAYTNFLLEKVYVYNTSEDPQKSNPLWRNDMEMKALKMSVLSQTYYKLMNGNDNSIGDASFSGAGVSISQSLPERNYIAEDVYQWLINARLLSEKKHFEPCEEFIDCKEISMNPLELAKRPYPDPVYVPSKFLNFTPYNLLQINDNGYVIQNSLQDIMKDYNWPEEVIQRIIDEVVSLINLNYNELQNRPQINGVLLEGDRSSKDLKLITQEDINAKANISLDNVNVGTGKENKVLSFDSTGAPKYVEQSGGGSGIVFKKTITLTNAYNGTSIADTGSYLYRTDGVNWNNDEDLKQYFDGKHMFRFINIMKDYVDLSCFSYEKNRDSIKLSCGSFNFVYIDLILQRTIDSVSYFYNDNATWELTSSDNYIKPSNLTRVRVSNKTLEMINVCNYAFLTKPSEYDFEVQVIKI